MLIVKDDVNTQPDRPAIVHFQVRMAILTLESLVSKNWPRGS